jgi:hypothetical protein
VPAVEEATWQAEVAHDLSKHGAPDRGAVPVVGKRAPMEVRGMNQDDLAALSRAKTEAGVVIEKAAT